MHKNSLRSLTGHRNCSLFSLPQAWRELVEDVTSAYSSAVFPAKSWRKHSAICHFLKNFVFAGPRTKGVGLLLEFCVFITGSAHYVLGNYVRKSLVMRDNFCNDDKPCYFHDAKFNF
ncbi:hypothetical protein M758_7G186800 [Ceratodon purpureus]|nr:hypothetical protein M758_7G186800 [Ceratodon purpureus]